MNTDTLHNSAMLVTLTISQWTARKYDKGVSKEVEKQHQAQDAGRFNKILVAKESLESINKIANAARAYHYKMTLPWGDNGDRLLPATLFEDYAQCMRQYKNEFNARVASFVRDYPQLKTDAIKRLGTMYNPLDYPAPEAIRDRFCVATEFSPVPTSGDFRVNLNAEYVDSIKSELELRLQTRQREAVKECYRRVREVVGHIHERLSDKEKTFRDTLISNAEELLTILPALNITGDQDLNLVADEVRGLLVAPDRLRQDETLRQQTAKRAEEILAKFQM
jgi:hypothetical protein